MFNEVTLDQITVFVAAVEQGGFTAAARDLGRVQSAVSQAVANLEASLGVKLFDRRTRPPRLTVEGQRLAAEARLVLAQTKELHQVAAALREGLEPTLTVAVDPIYPAAMLTEALAELRETYPTVGLRLHTDLLGEAVALVRDGVAQLGVCNLVDEHDPGLTALPCGRVRLVPVCAATHPLADEPAPQRADVLERHVQLVLSERTVRTDDRGVLAARTWRVTDLDMKARLIHAGVGWGSLPEPLAAPALAGGHLVQLRPQPWPDGVHDVPLHTVVRADRPLGPAGRWLRERLAL